MARSPFLTKRTFIMGLTSALKGNISGGFWNSKEQPSSSSSLDASAEDQPLLVPSSVKEYSQPLLPPLNSGFPTHLRDRVVRIRSVQTEPVPWKSNNSGLHAKTVPLRVIAEALKKLEQTMDSSQTIVKNRAANISEN